MLVSMSKCAQCLNEFAHAQVLNDLLDPSRANLKLREDPKRGFYVEGIKEETLVSAEHALSVIATGVAHRKVWQGPVVTHHFWDACMGLAVPTTMVIKFATAATHAVDDASASGASCMLGVLSFAMAFVHQWAV